MTEAEFQLSYTQAANQCMSYVGGFSGIEDDLWWQVEAHQKWAKRNGVVLPEYESIQQTQEDWV